ncbi:MAG: rhodanese-like domain-containing protein, partial [Bacteroidota bacterium]
PPAYFPLNVAMNKKGYDSIDDIVVNGMRAMSAQDFETVADATDALILDTRSAADFCKGFIPRSVNIGLDGQFAPWVGALIADVKQPILLVTDPGKEEESVIRLARVGFDNVIGHLGGGINAWQLAGKENDTIERITAADFAERFRRGGHVIDVRKENEFVNGHLEAAENLPLDNISEWWSRAGNGGHFYLHCQGGYRSMIAASILKSRGIHAFTEIAGGYKAISEAGVKVVKSETA